MDSRPEDRKGVMTVDSPEALSKGFSAQFQRAGSPKNQSFYFEYVRGDRHDFLRIMVDDKDKLHAMYATEGMRAATNYLKDAVSNLADSLGKQYDGLNQIDLQSARERMVHDEPLDSALSPIERLKAAAVVAPKQTSVSRFGLFGGSGSSQSAPENKPKKPGIK